MIEGMQAEIFDKFCRDYGDISSVRISWSQVHQCPETLTVETAMLLLATNLAKDFKQLQIDYATHIQNSAVPRIILKDNHE